MTRVQSALYYHTHTKFAPLPKGIILTVLLGPSRFPGWVCLIAYRLTIEGSLGAYDYNHRQHIFFSWQFLFLFVAVMSIMKRAYYSVILAGCSSPPCKLLPDHNLLPSLCLYLFNALAFACRSSLVPLAQACSEEWQGQELP